MPTPDAISTKDILEWTFLVASLDLGALGFIYNAYVTVRMLDEPLAVAKFLRVFCIFLAGVLVVLTGVSAITAALSGVVWQVWAIIGCLIVTTGLAIILAWWTD